MNKPLLFFAGVVLFVISGIVIRIIRSRPPDEDSKTTAAPDHGASSELPRSTREGAATAEKDVTSTLLIHVIDNQRKPVANAVVGLLLLPEAPTSEGPPQSRSITGTWIRSDAFSGNRMTDMNGASVITVHQYDEQIRRAGIQVLARAQGYVDDNKNSYLLKMPAPGGSRALTLELTRGVVVFGKIHDLDEGDNEIIFFKVSAAQDEGASKETQGWYDLVDVRPDGSFTSKEVPLNDLELKIHDYDDKYQEYKTTIRPPLGAPLDIYLLRNPESTKRCTVIVKLVGAGVKNNYHVLFYSIEKAEVVGWHRYGADQPDERDLAPGAYRVLVVPLSSNDNFWGEELITVPHSGRQNVDVQLRTAPRINLRLTNAGGGRGGIGELKISLVRRFDQVYAKLFSRPLGRDEKAALLKEGNFSLTLPAGEVRMLVESVDGKWRADEFSRTLIDGEKAEHDLYFTPTSP